MPYSRPTLQQLLTDVAQDISAALPGTDPLLKFSNLNIMGTVQAMLANLHYGYLDWIAQQTNPFTATDEFLEAWAALKGVTREPAASATGSVQFSGTNGTVLSSGLLLTRGDGKTFITTSGATIASGTATVQAIAVADPTGLTGAWGNCPAGTILTLGTPIAGVTSAGVATTAFTGGADLELDPSLRARMLYAYQNPAHGGSAADYVAWALQVPGVTRAWCVPHGFGAGTVCVFVMLDGAESAYGGFPQGSNGVAAGETRDTVATGDQLAVANYLDPLQPVPARVYVLAPSQNVVNFNISGLGMAGSAVQAAVAAAISGAFQQYGSVTAATTSVYMSLIEAAVTAVPGTTGFVITSPTSDIVSPVGSLPVLGTITWA